MAKVEDTFRFSSGARYLSTAYSSMSIFYSDDSCHGSQKFSC